MDGSHNTVNVNGHLYTMLTVIHSNINKLKTNKIRLTKTKLVKTSTMKHKQLKMSLIT